MLKAAVLGATGNVGQIFVQLLDGHPWFKTSVVAASERSKGRTYGEASRWRQSTPIPEAVAQLDVVDIEPRAVEDVDVVFSALPSAVARKVEQDFASAGYVVVSNASAHRMDPDVPMINPEINCSHVSLIEEQRRKRKWDGAIVTNPNCTTTVLTLPLKPIYDEFGIKSVIVSTMQAISGAGYPGVASLDIVDNVIPYIGGEEEKMETETQKILGSPSEPADFKVTASCHRVPSIDGHMEAVFVETKKEAEPNSVAVAMEKFVGEPQKLNLPSAPEKPVIVTKEMNRPQTRLDRMEGKGMSVVVGRIRKDPVLNGVKFLALGHNTIRGAAGCGVLNAEYLKVKNFI
ncbi:MAG: aspartate-semialdehyde dehydrogenase [Candidatus Bathyarchaeota archaeon]|nr:aspartate-semialdehyde dehydrogenase [Candidatus Bathyarchaeota archaeon]